MPSQSDLVSFTPSLRLRLEARDHVIKTAESPEEVRQALRLRYDVFYGEVLRRANPQQLDFDRFDSICDRLLVVETGTGRVVGTYRLHSSCDADYYSRQEFDIGAILRLEGDKLEIGRGCVAKHCRRRGVFMMLWKGIAEYMRRAGTRYLFGCSSMPASQGIERVAALYGCLLRKHYSSDERRVYPLKPLPARAAIVRNSREGEPMDETATRRLLPLLSIYLHAGAVICGEPAYDEDFRTFDFFTLLDVEALTNAGNKLFRTPDHGSFESVKAFMKEYGPHGFGHGQAVPVLWSATRRSGLPLYPPRACSRSFPLPASKLVPPSGKSGSKLRLSKLEQRSESKRRNNHVNPERA